MALNFGMVLQMVDTAISTDLGHIQIHASGYDANPELSVRMTDGGAGVSDLLEQNPEARAFSRRVRGEGLVTSSQARASSTISGIGPASVSSS